MMASSITDTQGIIAIAAAAVAVVALIGCATLALSVRRLRRSQRLVLGHTGARDVVEHATTMQAAFEEMRAYVEDVTAGFDARLAGVEAALRGTIAHRSLVRYDAYNEFSGQQSMSIALLDEEQSGIVLSCIHHRDQARVYAKQVRAGIAERELSPEEEEAVRLALNPAASEQPGDVASQPAG
jgi:Protein of unknown function (DUF4446)